MKNGLIKNWDIRAAFGTIYNYVLYSFKEGFRDITEFLCFAAPSKGNP